MTPIRIQRSRREKYPECGTTLTVTRPGAHGNQYVICGDERQGYWIENEESMAIEYCDTLEEAHIAAVAFFRLSLEERRVNHPDVYAALIQRVREADYIACWCKVGSPCHGDVWIELACGGAA